MAEELRRIREEARAVVPGIRASQDVLPPPGEVHVAPRAPALGTAETPPLPQRPDNAAVNDLWQVPPAREPGGVRGTAFRLLRRLLAPLFEAQKAFNSRQVQLDNEILGYIDERFDRTHRHYDDILGKYGRHIGEIDQRHLMLQDELVAHVHDLVRRIDLVLSESERGRVSLDAALRDVRARLLRLEERLPR